MIRKKITRMRMRMRLRLSVLFLSLLFSAIPGTSLANAPDKVPSRLTIICTPDVHGNYFPFDFVRGGDGAGSLARIYKKVSRERELNGGEDGVLLLDAGDILQGTPASYYYNFVDTTSVHVCAQVMNYMKYDAATIGNHDIETGHGVYDRWTRDCNFPVLAANVVDKSSGKPYWKPYVVVEKAGLRIAVFGLLTPTIPKWLPERLWSGLEFRDMVETAREYMPQMKREADVVVGLFHSGVGREPGDFKEATSKLEDATWAVARWVPGFDVIFCGHDHRAADIRVLNIAGDEVPVLNAGPHAENAATYSWSRGEGAAVLADARPHGEVASVKSSEPDAGFMRQFRRQVKAVRKYTGEVIGQNAAPLTTRDAYFGPSAFIDLVHAMQLRISGADVSLAAPLGFDASLPAGKLTLGQMFSLYPYENLLYVMRLSGRELRDYLEYSYAGWLSESFPEEPAGEAEAHFLRLSSTRPLANPAEHWKLLATPSYNFDSAAGIRYVVDVTRPVGQRVRIQSLADGRPFDMDAEYRVALNSYRGNGGGGHLTEGARIPKEELPQRILWSSRRDLRYHIIQAIRSDGGITPPPPSPWSFEPARIVQPLMERDRQLLFP
ncbi:MAG: bifunctional metallophosphatase/5'-nucleotidase [Alloprevotella sp.]|nr:bifunctional metallophosphatase/5'-nucleotidase [Alloprevotella sp.]